MRQPNRSLTSFSPGRATGHRTRRLVLLADGNRAHRRMLSIQLERAGYRVAEAADGATALKICREQHPDLILSDSLLMNLSGLELCRAHRALTREGYGYFILLTSSTDRADIAVALGAGADDFLIKPISSAELLARIRASRTTPSGRVGKAQRAHAGHSGGVPCLITGVASSAAAPFSSR